MIIKACYGSEKGRTHTRILECVDMHLESYIDAEHRRFVKVIVHTEKSREDGNPSVLELGKRYIDNLYIMDKGKTVDRMTFYPEAEEPKQDTDSTE